MLNAVRFGLLFSLAIFLWAAAESALGLHDRYIRYHEYLSYFFAVPSVGIMYWGVYARKNRQSKRMGFRSAFTEGVAITLVVTLLCPLVWYVFCTFVNPDFLGNMERHAVEVRGVAATAAKKRFSLSNYLLVSALSTAVIGVVIALVIAVIVAKRRS